MCYYAQIMKRIFAWVFLLVAVTGSEAWAQSSLRETFARRAKPVAVAVTDPVNRTGDDAVSPAALRTALEERLSARREPRFSVVADASTAEITVSAEIVEFVFTEHDPVDKIIGLAGAAYDAATVEHYARLTAVYTVRDAKSGRTLWTDKLKATVTDKTMSREESRPRVMARAAEIFVREAFGKKRK